METVIRRNPLSFFLAKTIITLAINMSSIATNEDISLSTACPSFFLQNLYYYSISWFLDTFSPKIEYDIGGMNAIF